MKETGSNAVWYWVVMLIYFGVVLYIGYNYLRSQRLKAAEEASRDYWVAGRKTGSLVVGMSIAAGWLLIGFITWAIYNTYMFGVGGIWAMVVPWFLLLFGMVILTPWVRRIKAISQPQMLHNRYGLSVRILSTPFNIFTFIVWSAAEVWTIAHIISPEFGVEPWVMYLVFSAPIAIYMWMGGFESVISANVVQFIMAAIFVTIVTIVAGVVAFRDLPEGVGLIDYLSNVTPPGLDAGEGGAWRWFSLGIPFAFVSIIALLPGWLVEEDWWLKAQSGRSTAEARRGVWANLVYNVVWVLLASSIIGLLALVIFPPETFTETLGGDAYAILPTFLSQEFPSWALVPLFAMLAALSMSTVSTFTNVCALNASYDFLQPLVYRKRGWSDERIMAWSRASSLVMVVVTVIVAFMIDLFPTGLWDAYYLSSGVLSAGVGVVVLGMFWSRANIYGALAASAVGGTIAAVGYFVEYYYLDNSYSPHWLADTLLGYAFVAVITAVVVFVVVSLVTPKPPAEKLAAISAEPVDDHEEFFRGVAENG